MSGQYKELNFTDHTPDKVEWWRLLKCTLSLSLSLSLSKCGWGGVESKEIKTDKLWVRKKELYLTSDFFIVCLIKSLKLGWFTTSTPRLLLVYECLSVSASSICHILPFISYPLRNITAIVKSIFFIFDWFISTRRLLPVRLLVPKYMHYQSVFLSLSICITSQSSCPKVYVPNLQMECVNVHSISRTQ